MLVTLEGIDGSGKTTAWEGLQENELFSDCTFTREPTDSEYGELLRRNLKNDTENIYTELFLFMTDHADHVANTVNPALTNDENIICDRYIDSRCAYQGHTLDDKFEDPVGFVYSLHEGWTTFPDITIFIDVSPKVSLNRLDTNEKYETEQKLTSIRENYKQLIEKDSNRYYLVNGEQTKKNVLQDITEILTSNGITNR